MNPLAGVRGARVTRATADQWLKGSALGVLVGLATYLGVDPALVAIVTPLVVVGLHWLSKQVGDPDVASFLSGDPKPEP